MALTDEQSKPVIAKSDHKLILAGPGTGKSFTILGFVSHLIYDLEVKPSSILLITFTRAATNELKQKVRIELGEESELPNIFTLHSFALRQLMMNSAKISSLPLDFSIANDFEERYLIMEDIKALIKAEKIKDVKKLFQLLSANWETLNIEKGDWEFSFDNPEFLGAWQEHRNIFGYLLRSELVYQLKKALEQEDDLKIDGPIEYLIVDEYQDLNKCDLSIIDYLRNNGTKVFCAGDDDQSIYGFRFAYPEGIRTFTENVENSEEFKLTECFRCDESILRLALNVIGQDPKRIPKKLVSMSGKQGEYHLLRFPNQYVEAAKIASIIKNLIEEKGIPDNEIIILLRSNHNGNFSRPIIKELKKLEIPINEEDDALSTFTENNGRYFLSLLKFLKNPQHDLALRTILELTNGLGYATFSSIYEQAKENKLRFHQIVEMVKNDEITDVKNYKKLKNTLSELYQLREDLKEEKDILLALEKLKEFIPDFSEDFKNNIKEILSSKEIESIGDLIDYTNELLGPSIEAPDETVSGIRIMSMHQAKGLTSQVVFIIAVEEEYTPGRGGIDEERRLFYVSITRAKHYLFMTYCNDRLHNQQHSGNLPRATTKRNLTRYLRDVPIISPVNGGAFKLI